MSDSEPSPTGPGENSSRDTPVSPSPKPQPGGPWWKYLTNENPCYLLSFACLLHGTVLSMTHHASISNPWPRMGMTCGYLLVCALIAWYVVRRLKLWNDART